MEFNLDAIPVYPRALLIDNIEGTAEIEFLVDAQGRAFKTKAVSATRREFGLAAVAAVESGAFAPALDDSDKDKVHKVNFRFSLDDQSNAPITKSARNLLSQLRKELYFHQRRN